MANFNYINENKLNELKLEKIELRRQTISGILITTVFGAIASVNAPEFFLAGISSATAITTGFAATQYNKISQKIKQLEKNK